MIGFCRWVADYYQAPLGEVLRAALPQGEQASATRAVRLTAAGAAGAGAPAGAARRRRASTIRCWRRWRRRAASCRCAGWCAPCRAAERRLPRLADAGLVEVGDEVQARRPPPTVAYARATGMSVDALPEARGRASGRWRGKLAAAGRRRSWWRRCRRPSATTLRALVAAGLARIEHREVRACAGGAGRRARRRGSR